MKAQDLVKPTAKVAVEMELNNGQARPSTPWPDPLAPEAHHGIVGKIVNIMDPHTEADPVAVLVQVLVAFGNVIGRTAHYVVEADRHYTNLFAVIVGTTSKGRKGTSWGQVRRLFNAIDDEWTRERTPAGLSSGEGLIWAVRDPIYKRESVKNKGRVVDYQDVLADPGVEDKRLLVVEAEFASTLQVIRRQGSNLSPLIRQAWDTGLLRTLTKNNPATATDAHISIIGHITKAELLRHLESTEAGNGFANRFLWICARRSKSLPDGGKFRELDLRPLERQLQDAIDFARSVTVIGKDEEAAQIWRGVYEALSAGRAGLLGAVTSRSEAQVIRLACVYALLDYSAVIRKEHIKAALAVWEYAEASARFIFGDALGDPAADEVLRTLRQTPHGKTRTEIRDLFRRNKSGHDISRALAALQEHGLAYFKTEKTDGRPVERWMATMPGRTTSAAPEGEEGS